MDPDLDPDSDRDSDPDSDRDSDPYSDRDSDPQLSLEVIISAGYQLRQALINTILEEVTFPLLYAPNKLLMKDNGLVTNDN